MARHLRPVRLSLPGTLWGLPQNGYHPPAARHWTLKLMALHVVILAAGQGTRMKSAHPKVLQPLAGRPLLAHVLGRALGLDDQWAYRIIKHVGNYGESYAKHVGPETDIGLERGLNALWTDGGLQYAMPIR